MVPYIGAMDDRSGFISLPECGELGQELRAEYSAAAPFPHIVIDDFLPEALLDMAIRHVENIKVDAGSEVYDRAQERFKTSYQPDTMDDDLRRLFYSFNSRPFIKVLENVTGIKGLIPDPYFFGGGIHEIKQGGHLSIHADFNHHRLMNLERRINVLIYLNKDWKAEYGGGLELWDNAMTACERNVVPIFNRCVIFNTTSDSQHGNPQPVNHPDGVSRKSIALYYYTATWDGSKRAHTTQFQVRPHSEDKRDWRIRLHELKDDLVPPYLVRKWDVFRRAQRARAAARVAVREAQSPPMVGGELSI